jgi:peroxiredoxin
MKIFLALLFVGFFSGMLSTNATADPQPIIGQAAPAFSLTDLHGKQVNLADYKGKIVVLEWINPYCPYSAGQYKSGNMPALQMKYTAQDVIWLTINSTNVEHANARPNEDYLGLLSDWGSAATAHLRDASGEVGKSYEAKTTPHMFMIDQNGVLAYAGAIDDDRSVDGGANAKINYVAQAIDELKDGKTVSVSETKPYGCSVKY